MTDAPAVFLPGILMPAAVGYASLVAELGSDRQVLTKELEVYAHERPSDDYTMRSEVAGLEQFANDHHLDAFHLYGHSAGGAIALAYLADHGARVLSLALNEPASDFSVEDLRLLAHQVVGLDEMAEPERMRAFAKLQVRPDVVLTLPPAAAPTPEMAKRPAGMLAFRHALETHKVDPRNLACFSGPVYYSYGSLSNARWEAMATRLAKQFEQCEVERYDGIHHLNTSHQAEPKRVADALHKLWVRAEANK
jgi:pimeloyl-ACP methyl ester carboxylesterase